MIVRHWFPVIAGGVTLALVLAVAVVYSSKNVPSGSAIPAETIDASQPAQTEEEYQQAVRAVLSAYASDNDASAAHDKLLYITRIPASMKDIHIGLVGAFGKLAAGEREDGNLRLQALALQYSWLSL